MTTGRAGGERDHCGRAHRRTRHARIVSLVPSLTETLFALDLDRCVVGRTRYCVHPAERLAAVATVGGTKNPDLERIAALAPTHVLVNVDENRREDVERIARIAEVVVTHPCRPRDNVGLFRLLGAVFARERLAEALAADFERALARICAARRSLPPRDVLYLIWRRPWMTVARTTYVSRTLALARWRTVGGVRGRRYPAIALAAAAREAALVLLSSEPFPFKESHRAEVRGIVGPRPRIELVDADMVSWYGSRAIAGLDYLRELAAALAAPRAR